MTKEAFLLAGLLLAMVACRPETVPNMDGSDTPEGTSVLLRVVTSDGDGIGIAKVSVDGVSHFADAAGFIQFESLVGDRFHARVDAPGFTSGAVVIDLAEKLNAYQEVELLPLGEPLSLDASLGGTVERDGIGVEIPPNAIVNRFGELVTGTIDVTIAAVDPSQHDELTALPGPLEGRSDLHEDVLLLTLGMAEISLWQGGEPLQLAAGATAMIHFEIPDELADSLELGTPIPAWSLDLDEGIWVQESMGVVEANGDQKTWTAEVDHFTWYNCDTPAEYEDFDCYVVTFVDEDDNTFISNRGFSLTAKLDANGFFSDGGYSSATFANVASNCVMAPKGSAITLTVQGQPNLAPVLPAPLGEGGACRGVSMPNTECTPATIKLPPDVICNNGSWKPCPYSGPAETLGVGICQASKDYCIKGGTEWSGCAGEITPEEFESCATEFDDNCNGQLNEVDAIDCNCSPGDTIPCYTGPVDTVFGGSSICQLGVRQCNPDPLLHEFLNECAGEQTPEEELDETPDVDENCDGLTTKSAPEAPMLELGFSQVKQFDFSWDSVVGAQYYRLLEKNVEDVDYVQVGEDIETTSVSLTVPVLLHRRLGSSYVLEACNEWGCAASEPIEVVGSLAEAIGYFKASNTDELDQFGESVALSADGSTLAVGAYEGSNATGIDGNQADESAPYAGAVYVFVRDEFGVWTQQAYVKASNTGADDRFGYSVALSGDGNTLAVGAHGEASNATGIDGNQADDSAYLAGAVYVFVREELGIWAQQAYVKASNTDADDQFGWRVALSGDGSVLAVAAPWENGNASGIDGNQTDNSAPSAGSVYVFVRDDLDVWMQQVYIKASNPEAGDVFGWSVVLSSDGNTLAVGAPNEASNAIGIDGNQADNSAPSAGATYVFVRDVDVWAQHAYVKASNPDAFDEFGTSVSLSSDGSTLAVGANQESSNASGIGGDQADNSAAQAGAVYVFARDDLDVWTQKAYVKAFNTDAYDRFGTSVSLSGDGSTLGVGAPSEDSNAIGINGNQADNSAPSAGAVYVFARDDLDVWTQQAYVKASNTDAGDDFGHSVALNGTLAIGAWEDSSASGIDGDQADNSAAQAGAVYLY